MNDAHDAHDEPAQLPEPNTPMWLPALGAVLFLIVGVWWITSSAAASTAAAKAAASADTAAAASAAPSASAAPAAAKPPGHP